MAVCVVSPAQTLSGPVALNPRLGKLGEIANVWLLSVVTLKRRLPLARMPFHLLGAHGVVVGPFVFALALRLGPVEQRLVNQPQRFGHRCNSLSTFDQPERRLLGFKRVARPWCFRHFRFPCLN